MSRKARKSKRKHDKIITSYKRYSDEQWSEVSTAQWVNILTQFPELRHKCNKWDKFKIGQWYDLLYAQPRLAKNINRPLKMPQGWAPMLLTYRPSLITHIDLAVLESRDWDIIYRHQEQLREFIDTHKDRYLMMNEVEIENDK